MLTTSMLLQKGQCDGQYAPQAAGESIRSDCRPPNVDGLTVGGHHRRRQDSEGHRAQRQGTQEGRAGSFVDGKTPERATFISS